MALSPIRLGLVEYGPPLVLAARDVELPTMNAALELLATHKVVSVRRRGDFVLVEPQQFVGTLAMPGVSIEVSPRFPELFAYLKALQRHRKVLRSPQRQRDSAVDTEDVGDTAAWFLNALHESVSVGFPHEEERERVVSSQPRGRLLFRETISSCYARGMEHRAVTERRSRRPLAAFARAVTTAASILQSEAGLSAGDHTRLDRLREVADLSLGGTIPQAILELGEVRTSLEGLPEAEDLWRATRAVLEAEEQVWDFQRPVPGGECRFADVTRLWEEALTYHLALSADGSILRCVGHPLRGSRMTLFPNGGPLIDPDVLVYREEEVHVVVDAKYSMSSVVKADDVYQVLTYARRLGANTASLVYLSPSTEWSNVVGESEDGVRVLGFGVSVSEVEVGLGAVARRILSEAARLSSGQALEQ